MSTYLDAPRPELSFGDVCEADFLYDVFVQGDARALRRETAPASFARRKWQLDAEVDFFAPVQPRDEESFVLAHGRQRTAVVLADDCLLLTALGRGGGAPTARRILFAPVAEATKDEALELEGQNFGRFPLRADEHHDQDAVVELRRCFMVDARDIAVAVNNEALVLRSLTDDTRDQLAIRWSAYASRRGPVVAADSAEKFAELLVNQTRAEDADALRVATSIAGVVAAAWGYEGRAVEGAGIAADENLDPQASINQLIEDLERLREASEQALASLREL